MLFAVLLSVAAVLPVYAENETLITNGDFEEYNEEDLQPVGWSCHSYEAEYLNNTENALFTCEQDEERGTVLHISVYSDDDAALYQTIAVEPSSIYRLSCYIRTEAVENGAGANIALREVIARSEALLGDNGWQKVELVGKTGPQQKKLTVSCRIGGYGEVSHGDAWFDGFQVEKLENASGEIIPFFTGTNEETDADAEAGGGSALPYILIAVVLIAAAVIFVLRRSKEGKSGNDAVSTAKKASGSISELELIKGFSFFDCKGRTMPGPTDTKLYFKKTDWIFTIALTAVYGVIAILRLGTLNFPTKPWSGNIGDTARIEFNRSVKISDIWQNSGISYVNYVLITDNGEEIAMSDNDRNEYGNMFRWAKLEKSSIDAATETTGVTLKVVGGDSGRANDPDLVMNEIAFFDPDGKLIECTAADASAAALVDEQSSVPEFPSYYNGMYFDELYHGRTAWEHINNLTVYEWTHPPLGKLIIALGILIFGMKPFGWRIMGTLFGIAMIPIMYCFGKRLLKRSSLAMFSTFIFAFDFMHFTQTRIATVDVYGVFFILLMTYFMYKFICMDIGDDTNKLLKPLALSGIFFGLGCASKWICIYTGAALAVLFFVKLTVMGVKSFRLSRVKEYAGSGLVKKFWTNAGLLCSWCIIFFVFVPLVIYSASYCRYYTAQWLPAKQQVIYGANPDAYESSSDVKLSLGEAVDTYIKGVINNQSDMYNYHSQLKSDHKASSPWWMWLGNLRPTWFYVGGYGNSGGGVGTISAFGNPAVWVGCTIATIILIFVLIFHRRRFPLEDYFLFVCMASSFLPWVLVPRSTYAYHFFATVPFITLAAGRLIGYWEDIHAYKHKNEAGKKKCRVPRVKYVWMAVVLLLFMIFYPVISGLEVSRTYIGALQWVPFHKYEVHDANDNVVKAYRIGWRFLDYEPSNIKPEQITIIKEH